MEKFELPLNPNYVQNWGVVDALRDLVANSRDAVGFDKERYSTEYYDNTKTLVIANVADSILEPKHLVMGATDKHDEDECIGQFGEGLKLALLVLLRSGCTVEIVNDNEKWTPEFVYSDKYETTVLEITIEKCTPHHEVVFTIEGVEESDWTDTQKLLIENRKHLMGSGTEIEMGTIYNHIYHAVPIPNSKLAAMMDENFGDLDRVTEEQPVKNSVYVGGIFICQHNMGFNIDFHPDKVKLTRDRDSLYEFPEALAKALEQSMEKRMENFEFDFKDKNIFSFQKSDFKAGLDTILNSAIFENNIPLRETLAAPVAVLHGIQEKLDNGESIRYMERGFGTSDLAKAKAIMTGLDDVIELPWKEVLILEAKYKKQLEKLELSFAQNPVKHLIDQFKAELEKEDFEFCKLDVYAKLDKIDTIVRNHYYTY